MKVAIGYRLEHGPWGGGNRFAGALAQALASAGHTVLFDLDDDDIDIILLMDPRARSSNFSFTAGPVLRYLAFRNPRTLVVHRINECDERKGTRTMNRRLRLANYCADHTVFIASWLERLPLWRHESAWSVILNGADTTVFNANGHHTWNGRDPLRLVTHHWGANWMKGFDVYAQLDRMLESAEWRDRLTFTYIGNLPAGFAFRNARRLDPLDGHALAAELRGHHVYVSASICEPAGMHHIEGALCGLPLLYRQSGALPEYCGGYGESFVGPDDFVDALGRILANYDRWQGKMAGYDNTADGMTGRFLDLFNDMLGRREEMLAKRRLWRNPLAFALNQIPF
jgi:glycosyltransferase involved in cell wall biosynthesis